MKKSSNTFKYTIHFQDGSSHSFRDEASIVATRDRLERAGIFYSDSGKEVWRPFNTIVLIEQSA